MSKGTRGTTSKAGVERKNGGDEAYEGNRGGTFKAGVERKRGFGEAGSAELSGTSHSNGVLVMTGEDASQVACGMGSHNRGGMSKGGDEA